MAIRKLWDLSDQELITSVRKLTDAATTFKKAVFKAKFRGEKIEGRHLQEYLRVINSFLKVWDDLSNDLAESMKEFKGSEDVFSIDYGYVKNWLFANYDYASVLPFADGVFKGISSNKFEEVEDLEDFRDHTTEKAFKDCADTIGGLVDAVTYDGRVRDNTLQKAGKLGLAYYQSVRNSGKLFRSSDRRTIYNAVKKTMEYLIDHIGDLQVNNAYINTRLYISAVNNIIDYGVYTMVAFATRSYIIASYAAPFIRNSPPNKEKVDASNEGEIAEAVQVLPDEHYNCGECVHVMKDADDARLKSPACAKDLCNTFENFLTQVGADPKVGTYPTYDRPYVSDGIRNSSSYCNALRNNVIYNYFFGDDRFYGAGDGPDATVSKFNEIVVMFRDFMYDHKLALPNANSPREEFLHVIRGVEPDKQDLKGYQQNAYDLYLLAITLVNRMEWEIKRIMNTEKVEKNSPTSSAGTANDIAECLRIMNYVYREFTHALIQKARYIEAKINWLQQEDLNKAIAGVQIKIPGMKDEGPSLNDYMMSSVPDTIKMPIELTDLYALPVFESLEIFDESLRMLPEFQNDLYLSEAAGLSQLINAIKALIAGARKQFENFYRNATVQAAVKWTQKNGDNLKKMNFNSSLTVLPYKDNIRFGQYAKRMIDGINSLDINSLKTNEDVTAFVKKLYPDDQVYEFFTGDDPKVGARKYRNFILFQELGSITDKPVERVTYDGNMLKQKVGVWVDTVNDSKETFDMHGNLTKQLDQAIDSLKAKVVNATNNPQQTTQTTTAQTAQPAQQSGDQQTPPPTPTADGNPSGSQTTPAQPQAAPAQQNQQQDANNAAVLNFLLTEVQNAQNRLWVPATGMFIEYIKAHYQNIRSLYQMGQQTTQPQPQAAPQQ